MDITNVCRCCLSKGMHKDLNCSYIVLEKSEVYADMLKECFDIVLTTSYKSNSICSSCISSLRASLLFRRQVLSTEQEFVKKLQEMTVEDQKPFVVKLEPVEDSGDESDNYFLADTVRDISDDKIKIEVEEPKKKMSAKVSKMAANSTWRAEKIKNLVTQFKSISALPDITIKKTPQRKLAINTTVVWTSRKHVDKNKHRQNLVTILNYSNATPFRNKTLLGFVCDYCESTFADPADLRSHTLSKHEKERQTFKANFDMTEYNVKLDITDLTCTLCDSKIDNLSLLKEHLVKNHDKVIYNDIKDHIMQFKLKKGDVYDCCMCTATYETFKMLKQHMNMHYSNYICGKCNASFATKRSLNAHNTTHEEGSFKCDQCEKVFTSRTRKLYHEKTKHLGARNISNCPHCNESFRSYYQRNQHMIKVHNTEAQYRCKVCTKTFVLKSLLMYHIKKNHLMERNCQCTECGYRFFSKKALKAHMVKHTGERNYKCEVCNKCYARKYTLREHMRIHNNDRRFRCEVCALSFVQKCSLKSHLLSNHGISMAASDITCHSETVT